MKNPDNYIFKFSVHYTFQSSTTPFFTHAMHSEDDDDDDDYGWESKLKSYFVWQSYILS